MIQRNKSNIMDESKLKQGIDWLAESGLNMFAVLDCAELPTAVTTIMHASNIPFTNYSRLVLTGHGGKTLWSQLQQTDMSIDDPVDSYSLNLTQQFIDRYLNGAPSLIIYPSETHIVPLGQLGELSGWSHPSPLGQGISSEYGIWFAYRTAFLTMANIPTIINPPTPSPCDSCADKPCLSACPVSATGKTFEISLCTQHRLQPNSPCADRCLARMACPIAPQHHYTLLQIQYHYGDSMKTLKRYYST
jgi:epoxyqueuosine reductase